MVKDWVMPLLPALLVAISSYVAIQTTVSAMKVEITDLKQEVQNLRVVYSNIADLRVEKAEVATKLEAHLRESKYRDDQIRDMRERINALEDKVQ